MNNKNIKAPRSVCYVFDLPTSSPFWTMICPNMSKYNSKQVVTRQAHITDWLDISTLHLHDKETSPDSYIYQQMIHLQPFKHHVSRALAILELDINLPRPWTFRPGATGDSWKSRSHHLRLHTSYTFHTIPNRVQSIQKPSLSPRKIPVVPHKAVAEVSRTGNYRRDWLLWVTDGRAKTLMDRTV